MPEVKAAGLPLIVVMWRDDTIVGPLSQRMSVGWLAGGDDGFYCLLPTSWVVIDEKDLYDAFESMQKTMIPIAGVSAIFALNVGQAMTAAPANVVPSTVH